MCAARCSCALIVTVCWRFVCIMYPLDTGRSHVEQAAIFIKYIAKIVYSVTVYQVANFTQDEATVVAWFTALEQVLARPLYEPGTGKQPEQPADVLERDDWVWWKCKRRVARVLDTVMEKFGNLSSIPASNTEDRAFSAHFRKHVVARVFPQVMNMVAARFKDNVFVADKCLAHLMCVPATGVC